MAGKRFMILVFALMFFSAGFTSVAIAQETEIVYIGEGDHYASGPYYAWGDSDLWVNMTVAQGGNVDVYVMTMNQYMNAYPYEQEPGGIAFKSCSQENVSQVNIYHLIEIDMEEDYWGEEEIWVIIDNREVNATPNDASPSGVVRVELEIDWTSDEFGYEDDFYWFILMFIGSFAPIILIVVLLFLVFKKKETPPPYYPLYPAPQEPMPPTPPAEQTSQEPVPPEPPETQEET